MSIEISISQRCGGEFGQPIYFAQDCLATFTLDGNVDNAQMMAGYAIEGMINAHAGDVLLITVRCYGKLVARYFGVSTKKLATECSEFVNGHMFDWSHHAQRLTR